MRTVASAQNPSVRALRALRQDKGRRKAGCFLAEGPKLVAEALRDAEVVTLLVDEERATQYAGLIQAARDAVIAPKHVVAAVGEARTPQGIVASVRFPPPLDLDAARGAVLVLDGVQDPGNVGGMLRTAEAAGFTAALLSTTCADAFAPKSVRGTMGSIFRLPLWRGALPEALAGLQRRGFLLISAETGGLPFSMAKAGLRPPAALVIGSEGNGVSDAVSRLTDVRVALPMRGRAESLNAAVAAGILMYGLTETAL